MRGRPKKDRFETRGREDGDVSLSVEDRFESADRDAYIRRNLKMGYKGPFDLDTSKIPQDMEYQFVAETVGGAFNENGLRGMKPRGFTPVPESRHPEMLLDGLIDDRDRKRDGILRSGGQICFERHKRYGDIERENSRQQNLDDRRTIPGLNKLGDRNIPFMVQSDRIYQENKRKSFSE